MSHRVHPQPSLIYREPHPAQGIPSYLRLFMRSDDDEPNRFRAELVQQGEEFRCRRDQVQRKRADHNFPDGVLPGDAQR